MNKQNIRNIIELFISWNDENMPIDVANIDSAVDYIYSCQEPIDEDKLKKFKDQCMNKYRWYEYDMRSFLDGVEIGYRKAREE